MQLFSLLGIAAAFTAAVIWALVIFLYKKHMAAASPLSVNFSRVVYVSLIMWPVLTTTELTPALLAAVLSGVVTLVVGDSMYLYAISKVGGSVAAPVAYTYIVATQYFALALGEGVTTSLLASAVLVVLGVALLSQGEERQLSPLGLAAAVGAAASWSLGVTAIKIATLGGVPPLAVAYVRALSAALTLGIYRIFKKVEIIKSPLLAAASVADLGLGAALFVFSIEKLGLSLATVLVATSPLVTQLYAAASGAERVTAIRAAGGVTIFVAVVLALSH
ncbi:MAG: EamA family transporter [Pyrobaculum sp.]